MNSTFACLQPVLEADARHLLHLLVGRVAAEVRRDDRGVAEHLGDQRVGAAAEGRRQDRALVVDHVHVALALVGAQLVDLLLEIGVVGREQVRRQAEAQPARIVAVEAALEVAGHRREAARSCPRACGSGSAPASSCRSCGTAPTASATAAPAAR